MCVRLGAISDAPIGSYECPNHQRSRRTGRGGGLPLFEPPAVLGLHEGLATDGRHGSRVPVDQNDEIGSEPGITSWPEVDVERNVLSRKSDDFDSGCRGRRHAAADADHSGVTRVARQVGVDTLTLSPKAISPSLNMR